MAAGSSMQPKRNFGRKMRQPLTKSSERYIFRPLFSDVPAVMKKYVTACHPLSFLPFSISLPDT